MRILLLTLPVLLMAQAPAPKPAPAKAAPAAAKTAAAGPAAAKPAVPRPAAKPATAAPVVLATDDEKAIYALGLSMYKSLGQFDLSPHELDLVKRALVDSVAGKPAIDLIQWGPKIGPLAKERSARVAEHQKVASKAYLEKAATEPGAVRAPSGLIYRELRAGTGDSPKASDTVKVHYRGTLVDGTEFDSSYRRNEPAQFALNAVVGCWTEGLQKMKKGGKAMLICPSDLAYGDQGRPGIPGGATLVFEIELLEIAGGVK